MLIRVFQLKIEGNNNNNKVNSRRLRNKFVNSKWRKRGRKFRSVKRKKRKGFCGKMKQEKERLAEDDERDHLECIPGPSGLQNQSDLVSADHEIQSADMTTQSDKSDDMNETTSNFVQDITDGKNMSASKLAYSRFR